MDSNVVVGDENVVGVMFHRVFDADVVSRGDTQIVILFEDSYGWVIFFDVFDRVVRGVVVYDNYLEIVVSDSSIESRLYSRCDFPL